jgi:ubiquinone/menaquinone biosynthesis C-methylase UbiE
MNLRTLTTLKARALRAFFDLLYHQIAWVYDLVAFVVSLGYWKSWVYSVIPQIQGGKILEIGHGPGHLQVAFAARGYPVFGLDESAQMGNIAHRRLRNSSYSPRLARGYAQNIPFPKDCFQHVVSTFPSEYILDPNTIAELHRVLIPGGSLVILPVAWIQGNSPFHQAAAWLFRVTDQAIPWNANQLAYFTRAGFHLQHIRCQGSVWETAIILAKKLPT